MEPNSYCSSFKEGSRVLLVHDKHPKNQNTATVVTVLPNPSRMPTRQWYDVRFDNGTWGRFVERYLVSIPANAEPVNKTSAA